jgi:hypothetical protein
MNRNGENRHDYFAWGCVVIGCVMLIASFLSAPARGAVAGWPVRPKDTPTPGSKLVRGAIELHVTGLHQSAPLFAVVQWQDGLGRWHDIDEWRGEIKGDRVTWDVAAKDLGSGPFRWLVIGLASAL